LIAPSHHNGQEGFLFGERSAAYIVAVQKDQAANLEGAAKAVAGFALTKVGSAVPLDSAVAGGSVDLDKCRTQYRNSIHI
jgi:hypothetical protein